jgi:hypothetical protein
MTHTYDLRNRWYNACVTFCGFTSKRLSQFQFDGHALTRFCSFVQSHDYVFTDADLCAWAADQPFDYSPLIRLWMSEIPNFKVTHFDMRVSEDITIAIL